MYYRIDEFIENWDRQAEITSALFASIPENSGKIVVCDEIRSADRLAFHIAQGMVQISLQAGLLEGAEIAENAIPDTIAQTLGLYRKLQKQIAEAVRMQWTDKMLTEEITMYGLQFRRGEALSLLEHHEMHHRGQLSVIMCMNGLPVPEPYGLNTRDWLPGVAAASK